MAKQSLEKRIESILLDCIVRKGEKTDPRDRWDKVKEDLPEECRELEEAIGEMREATLDDVPREKAVYYSARDADATLRILPKLWSRIQAMGLEQVYKIDMAIVPMVDRMQMIGMPASTDYFHSLEPRLTRQMQEKVDAIEELTKWRINPGSGDQVAPMLIALGVPLTKMTKGGTRESTNDKVLESFRGTHPAVGLVCDYRELAKLRDSFCVVLPKKIGNDGRIRCNFRITRVSSGRLSATKPNLLAIPVRTELGKEIRAGFIAPQGRVLGSWDLDQIEMRYMADESRDPVLCGWFLEGRDVHTQTAAQAFGVDPKDVTKIQRYAAKRLGFGVITGITEIGLAEQMALAGAEGWPVDRCKEFISIYFQICKGVKSYIEECRAEARRYGFVRDRWGRIRYLPGVWSDIWWIREEALRQSHSHKIQAGAQGLMKRAMKEMWDMWKLKPIDCYLEPLLQIHDEIIWEIDDEPIAKEMWNEVVINCLTQTTSLRVPVKTKGSYAQDWGGLKD